MKRSAEAPAGLPVFLLLLMTVAFLASACASATRRLDPPPPQSRPLPSQTEPALDAPAGPLDDGPVDIALEAGGDASELDALSDEEAEGEEEPLAEHDALAVTPPWPSPEDLAREREIAQEQAPRFDIPMVVNDRVIAWTDFYSGPHREKFLPGLVRSGRYLPMIHRIFGEEGLPLDLAYMAHVESAYKVKALSRAKAKGMFQFMQATGRRYGLKTDAWVDERSDPEMAARAAAAYLKDLYAEFGDWYLALAAYNAGEGKIRRGLASTGSKDFWALAQTSAIRTETKNYVPAILAAALISKSPAQYGFAFEPSPPLEYDTLSVDGAVDLRVLARCAGADFETLRELNPALRRTQTPPGRTTLVRVPAGRRDQAMRNLAAVPAQARLLHVRHVVRPGDTLSQIARRYHVTVGAIQEANRMGRRTLLQVGRELVVPTGGAALHEADGATGGGRTETTTYRVIAGDTLSQIARRFGTTPSAIASASGIRVDQMLRVGDRLRIPAGKSAATTASPAVVHTVRPGENLTRIAQRYRTSVEQLCRLNDIPRDAPIHPGTRLMVR